MDLDGPCPWPGAARNGMRRLSADLVLRAPMLKQMRGFSYMELSFALCDSVTYRSFCRLGIGEPGPSKSARHPRAWRAGGARRPSRGPGTARWVLRSIIVSASWFFRSDRPLGRTMSRGHPRSP